MHPLFDPNGLSDEDLYKLRADLNRKMSIAHRNANNHIVIAQLKSMIDNIEMVANERTINTMNEMTKNTNSFDTDEYWNKAKENSLQWKYNVRDDVISNNKTIDDNINTLLNENQQKFKEWQNAKFQTMVQDTTTEPKKRGRPKIERSDVPTEPKKRGRPKKQQDVV